MIRKVQLFLQVALRARRVTALALVAWSLAFYAEPAVSAIFSSSRAASNSEFPRPPEVARRVQFWERVFSEYTSQVYLIHDEDEVDRIVDVIDFKVFNYKNLGQGSTPREKRDDVAAKYAARYQLAVSRFKKYGKDALQYGAIEKRIYSVYRTHADSLERLFDGRVNVRAQQGVADEFARAADRAEDYLPYMEQVFRSEGLPLELTRLPFVESMFNLKAYSKVGASGIWQFMPETARIYMNVNHVADERSSPYKATRAAARLLADNFETLKSWPLAVTAYNHGTGGMQRAVKSVGTSDFGEILKYYQSPSFGFASKNFYAELLAANSVYDKMRKQGKVSWKSSVNVEKVSLVRRMSVNDLVRMTPLTKETLMRYNPCIRSNYFTSKASTPLPAGFDLFVPKQMANKVKLALVKAKQQNLAIR